MLAERISEKASMLLRVEEQKTMPSDKLVKKLEKELGIKLFKEEAAEKPPASSASEPISLWDAATKKGKAE